MTAIFEFLDNKFPLGSDSGNLCGKFYKELPKIAQNQFDDYELHIEKCYTDNDDDLRELFKRLQLGTPLNSGERLMAVGGDMHDFVLQLSRHKFFNKMIAVRNSRYAHFTIAAQISLLGVRGIGDMRLRDLEDFFGNYSSFQSKGSEGKKIRSVIDYLSRVFEKDSESILKNRAIVISFFWLIFDLMTRDNILGKEEIIYSFAKKFVDELTSEVKKGADAKDPDYLYYQSATTQGADKQKSIRDRHKILIKKLAEYSQYFGNIVFIETPEQKFSALYGKILLKYNLKDKGSEVDHFLKSKIQEIRIVSHKDRSRNVSESLPVHIRHCIHHRPHGEYSSSDIRDAITYLQQIS
jgi:hypothetical protein